MKLATIKEETALRVEEFARILGYRVDTIYRWIREGRLNKLQIPGRSVRISSKELERFGLSNVSSSKPASCNLALARESATSEFGSVPLPEEGEVL